MGRYLIGRLVQMLVVFLLVTAIVFLMLHIAPGDPISTILGTKAGRVSEEVQAELRRNLGLDLPLAIQYFKWISNAIKGDLGRSLIMRQEVFPLVINRFKATALLALGAMVMAIPFGIGAGVLAAIRRNSIGDRIISTIATMGICTPTFFLGILLILLFALWFGWLPASGMQTVGVNNRTDLVKHMILPSVCLAAPATAVIARMTRSSLLEIMTQNFITTARSKGVSEVNVIWRHAFRNALVSVITVVGLEMGFMLGGAVLVEVVFSWPGVGMLLWDGVLRRDFPVVQGAVLVVASSYVVINFLVDTFYVYIDPRLRRTS